MATVKFSELPIATPVLGDEYLVGLAPSGSGSDDDNVIISVDDLATYILSQDSNTGGGQTITKGAAWTNGGLPIVAADANVVYVQVPDASTITSWTILTAGGTGSCVIDVWKDTYANYPPTVDDSITGGNEPAVTAGIKDTNSVLSGWDTAVAAGDIVALKLTSSSTFTFISITLTLEAA